MTSVRPCGSSDGSCRYNWPVPVPQSWKRTLSRHLQPVMLSDDIIINEAFCTYSCIARCGGSCDFVADFFSSQEEKKENETVDKEVTN